MIYFIIYFKIKITAIIAITDSSSLMWQTSETQFT
jgi:hypothetical protein